MNKVNVEVWLKEMKIIWDRQDSFPENLFRAALNNVSYQARLDYDREQMDKKEREAMDEMKRMKEKR